MGNIAEDEQFKIPEMLPMLPVRDTVIFPYMILPLFVGGRAPSRPWMRLWPKTG